MKNEIVRARVTAEFKKMVDEVAKKENRTTSNIVETALKEYMNNHGYSNSTEKGK